MLQYAQVVRKTTLYLCKAALACLCLIAPLARGAETVTLRSGFTITCIAREAISAATLRLYLSGDRAGANYIDIPLNSVEAIDAVPSLVENTSRISQASVPPPSELAAILQMSGAAHNVSVSLLAAVVKAESAGNPLAVSHAGARGLMQLMPATAAQLHVKQSFEPADNVNGGSAYLDGLLTRYHENIALALAAYNAGPGTVDRYHGMPPFRETRLYVARVLREFNRRVRQEAILRASRIADETSYPAGMRAHR